MRGFGDAVLATGTKDEKVRRQYAQSLIEQKAYARALEVLASIVGDPNSRPSEVAEAQGLIGRTFKQQYVDDPRAPGADALLRRAIEAYESVYKADSTQLWHGVNAASSILRAHRDGVTGVEPNRAREIAERVLEHFEVLERSGELGVWDYASREEALLALEDYDVAAAALDAYITHPDMHAFEVSSTYRQFDQVLRLGEDPRGRPILDRLWEAVERYRAGGLSSRPSPPSDHSESVTAETVGRPLLIRVADPDWQPERVPNLVLQARLGTIVSAQGSDASVKQLLKDPDVISVDESLPAGVGDCDKSVPFIGVAANYPGPGGEYSEKGDAALIAVIDDGIDVLHEAFLDAQGQSRIEAIWDQTDKTGPPPSGFNMGTYHAAADIAGYIRDKAVPKGLGRNWKGHGTHVASIAAGRAIGSFFGGVAPDARLLVVISAAQGSIGYSTSHLEALAFVEAVATRLELPVVVNVSQGMNAGAHDGKSALEVAFDEFSKGGRKPGRVVVKSAGNEREKGGHAKITLAQDGVEDLFWNRHVDAGPEDRLELWWSSADEFEFQLYDPAGNGSDWVGNSNPKRSDALPAGGPYLMQFTKRHVDNGDSKLEIQIGDGASPAAVGSWRLLIRSYKVPQGGEIHAWIERGSGTPSSFSNDHMDEEMTLSIPGTAQNVITVGAVGAGAPIRVGAFSSYGPTRDNRKKPELAAPGVQVRAGQGGSGTGAMIMGGTSMAAPHVAGAIALLLSRMKKSGQPIPTSTQIASAICQKTRNYNSRWDRGQGFGVVDVAALLAAF